MIDYWAILATFIGLLFGSGAFFAGLGYFMQGKKQGKLDANNLLSQDVEALTKKVNQQTIDIEALTQQVKDLNNALDQKDKKFAEAVLLLEGRDPHMKVFMQKLEEYIELGKPAIHDITTKIVPTIEKIDKIIPALEKLDEFLEVQKKFH